MVGLYVSVTRIRAVGLHAQCHYGICLCHEVQSVADDATELYGVGHQMVAGRYHYVGFGISRLDVPAYICYTGGGIPSAWLTQDVSLGYFGQLAVHQLCVILAGGYPYVARVNHSLKPVEGQLEQRAAAS